ncbi:ubiquitin-associated protein 2-like isoform X2 [Centropristis striata]|uniref:ubiquitin-associated protein 2-like isoform X2 n=1 Tax=Centropristis striata TaxID=184440 RepID=UPI0027DF96A3|nr:ubiquitin-associated protein 2-like isoform X2 [Centropristis striata]
MMTSVVSNQARGTRDRTLPTTTQTTQPQKQIQATAEQIRLAQMIYDKNDADFEDKVKQLIEVTGKTQDECMVALHDCNEDVNRAINFLLESTSDTNSWETVGKKRSLGKEGGPSEIKESREKKGGDRETSRGRGASNRRGRGISRGREGRVEENGFELAPGDRERGGDRGRRGRGRGAGVRGRGRAAAGNRFSSQGMGTFNPADYTANSRGRQETWDGNEPAEGTGTWGGNVEDWASEDWNEDLSETKVFTASSPSSNHITPGPNVDLACLLPKTGVASMDSDLGVIVDGPSAEDLGQSLVFTNSHHNGRTATHSYAHATANSYAHAASASTTYAHAALSSVLGSGFGSLNAPKLTPASDIRTSDQLNGPRLGQRASQTLATASNISVSKDAGPPPIQIPAPACSPSVEVKPQRMENGPVTAQHLEIKLQPEPSAVLSQLAQRQQQSSILPTTEPLGLSHAPQVPTPPGHESSVPPVRDGASPGVKLPGMELSVTEPPQRQLKTQRRRVPPPSKIPSSAVEMPGSADVPGLNVQFGALDFGSEAGSGTVDMAQTESVREQAPAQGPATAAPVPMPVPSAVPTQQPQSSLFSKPGSVSEHMSSLPTLPLAVSDPSFPSPSLGLPSATPSPSMGLPSAAAPPSSTAPTAASRVESSGPRSLPPHMGFSQSKDAPSAASLTNGYSGMKTQSTQDPTSSTSRTVKTESPVMTSDSGHHIPSPAVTPSHSTSIPSLSSHVTSTHSSGSVLATSSSLTISNEEGSSSGNLHGFPSSSSSQAINSIPSIPPTVSSSIPNGLHPSGAPGLTPNGTNATLSAAGNRTAPLLTTTSGKAPPNLAQGVPPLLANQYIMGPGGLLPAYPQIYGYEDLQMLQSRLPMDYYGVTFPGTTAAMPGRDGLANNPYSGEATKFGRNDSSSPAPPSSMSNAGVQSQPQQAPQAGTQGQGQAQGQQTQNQAFLNPPLPPGYGYTGLPYYAGMPGVPSAFQYGPTVFVPPASAKQPAMGLANPSNQYHQQHQPSYGQHAYGTAPGLSGSGTSGGVPDMGGSIYSKTQSFDKQGFHTGTPPPFSLPSALGGTGPLNPGGAPGYAPAPFLHILPPHQQPHSQLLHHHLTQDGQGGPGQRSQSSSMQQKTQGSKSSYGSSPYWAN